MGKRQGLGHKKHLRVIGRVGVHLEARNINDSVTQSWAEGGNEYWFRTSAGRTGWWNPKTEEVRFRPPTDEIAMLLAQGAAMTCPGGRTASLCSWRCQLLGMDDGCAEIAANARRERNTA